MTKKLFMDVHVLQTVPPSCINRDDTGSPKSAVYGGVNRARVSSQAWKSAMRKSFVADEIFPIETRGYRTKKIMPLLADRIAKFDSSVDSNKVAKTLLDNAGLKFDKKKEDEQEALFFISSAQLDALVDVYVQMPDAGTTKADKEIKTTLKQALQEKPSVDLALFGRMVASDPSLNIDASAQVAHAISTHQVVDEYDYFTAVDDVAAEDHAGAGHLGTVEYNSSTLYRYATVAVHDFRKQIGEDAAAALAGFVRAFALSMPTGKQNTFANRTVPYALLVTIRGDQPVNLVGAFEEAVGKTYGQVQGYEAASAEALKAYAESIESDWLAKPLASFVVGQGLDGLGERCSFDELLANLEALLGGDHA